MSTPDLPQVYVGRRIALPETRQLDVLAGLFERRGAEVIRCPLVSIHDAPDQEPIRQWLERFLGETPPGDLVLLTGEGVKRLHAAAERLGLADAFLERLGNTRLIARGPKPGRALKQWGISPAIQAEIPTSDGIIATLRTLDDLAPEVGVVLYGTEPNLPLIHAITKLGRIPLPVAPYIYADQSETQAVNLLIARMAAGEIDAMAFTSQPQINRLRTVAEKTGMSEQLALGLEKTIIAAIGPVMADHLRTLGIHVDVMPEDRYFMRPLVDALAEKLADTKIEDS
ncbi:uroporphyrinogen-III synthase [Halothiobacillus sp.]|uniref:uroporphyrinogen-III synthase n=1 Tax=Halothiobacillus sp. TaxID=1891311 RepID=UPI002AD245CF|nr:uroporphyrinogen-III synthase [Halothiobacillus sp.]